jgi:hypothetical protein
MIFGRRYLALVSIKRGNVNRFWISPILNVDASSIFKAKIISVQFMPSHFEPLSFDGWYRSFYTCQRTSKETEHLASQAPRVCQAYSEPEPPDKKPPE